MGITLDAGWRRAAGIAVLAVNVFLAALFLLAPVKTQTISASEIRLDQGFSYVVLLAGRPSFPFSAEWDTPSSQFQSSGEVLEDGRPLGPAHALHADIRAQGVGRFSFWSGSLLFSTSDNSDPRNNGRTYSMRYKTIPSVALTFAVMALDVISAVIMRAFLILRIGPLIGWIAEGSLRSIRILSWGAVIAAILYGATFFYGLAVGYALPTSTIFVLMPAVHFLSGFEPLIPWGLLVVAAVGAMCGWAATIGALSKAALQTEERKLIRLWSYAGFPVIAFTFLFAMSGGEWSGHFASTNYNYVSVGGLVPNSDASPHFASAFDLAYWGHWNYLASRRPFAAAFRGFTVLAGGLSYSWTLIVQATLIAAAIMVAMRSVTAWRGIWVAIALCAFVYGLARPFILTIMTEPLGLIWSLISLAFFFEALRLRSSAMAVVGFAALVCALMTRMGSMFTVPILMLWIPLAFARGYSIQAKILGLLGAISAAIFVWNFPLAHLYATPGGDVGGNFADTLCGLARGTDWLECDTAFAKQLATTTSIHDRNVMLYTEALQAILANPQVLLSKVWQNISAYFSHLPHFMLQQYILIASLSRSTIYILMLFLVPGWLYLVTRRDRWQTLSFAVALLASTGLSAGIVFTDDGPRVLHVTYPFMAMIFAIGFSTPTTLTRLDNRPTLSWRWGAGAIVTALIAFLVGPPVVGAAIRWATDFNGPIATDGADERVVTGRPALSGFLVLPDGTVWSHDIPTLDASTFARVFGATYRLDLGPTSPDYLPMPPFAVVNAQNQNASDAPMHRHNFIVPPEVLTSKGVRHWRFKFDTHASPPNGAPFFVVTKATPIE